MVVRNSLSLFSEIISYSINQFRKIYLSSNIYNKKISKIHLQSLVYKPSPNLLDCLINFERIWRQIAQGLSNQNRSICTGQ